MITNYEESRIKLPDSEIKETKRTITKASDIKLKKLNDKYLASVSGGYGEPQLVGAALLSISCVLISGITAIAGAAGAVGFAIAGGERFYHGSPKEGAMCATAAVGCAGISSGCILYCKKVLKSA